MLNLEINAALGHIAEPPHQAFRMQDFGFSIQARRTLTLSK